MENETEDLVRVPARPFVSGVESRAALREGQWHEISGEGERESDWETSCDAQWKFWSLIGHLIYWSYRGDWASDYLRDYLVLVCFSLSLSFFLSFSLSSCLSLSVPLSLPLPATVSSALSGLSSSQDTALTLFRRYTHPNVFDNQTRYGTAANSLSLKARTNIWVSMIDSDIQ